jgi:hypothetical protein
MADTPPVVRNDKTHRFEVTIDGQTAFAEYNLVHDALVLPHTVVPEALGGRGIAGALAEAALAYAHEQGLKVKPFCSYIAGYITRHPEWHDIVHPAFRKRLGLPA